MGRGEGKIRSYALSQFCFVGKCFNRSEVTALFRCIFAYNPLLKPSSTDMFFSIIGSRCFTVYKCPSFRDRNRLALILEKTSTARIKICRRHCCVCCFRSPRMTAGGLPPSKQDSTAQQIENVGNVTGEVSTKDPEVLHDTRSQKQASKKRPQEDHADTTKDSTLATAHETANNFVGVATRSSTRPTKRIKSSNSSSSKAGNQGMIRKIITLAINNFHFATAILTLHAKLSLEHENVHHSFG